MFLNLRLEARIFSDFDSAKWGSWTKTHFHVLRSALGASSELNNGFFLSHHKVAFKRSGNS